MPKKLKRLSYDLADSSILNGYKSLDFGSERYAKEISSWLKDESLECSQKFGTKIWLYYTEEDGPIGFASLGENEIRHPDKKSPSKLVWVIPAIGVDKKWRTKPEGPRTERFSWMILDNIVSEAISSSQGHLGIILYVDEINIGAIKLYQNYGFIKYYREWEDRVTNVKYLSYLFNL